MMAILCHHFLSEKESIMSTSLGSKLQVKYGPNSRRSHDKFHKRLENSLCATYP